MHKASSWIRKVLVPARVAISMVQFHIFLLDFLYFVLLLILVHHTIYITVTVTKQSTAWMMHAQKMKPLFNVLSLQSDVSSCKTHTTESTIHIAIIQLASSISTWCYTGV